ncbi:MAG: HIT domain-containing protein [bacterium]|nr:HIT domain-containing protein [bacterium]
MIFRIIKTLIILIVGIGIGAYFFNDTQPRSFVRIKNCETNCLNPQDLAGLLVSAGIQKTPSKIPGLIKETEKTVVVDHPFPETEIHYVVFPKKDIKNISEVSQEDQEYIMDSLATIRKIVKEKNLENYQVITNGPGYQQITYLHFHLMSGPVRKDK